jgi:hypothetical protein
MSGADKDFRSALMVVLDGYQSLLSRQATGDEIREAATVRLALPLSVVLNQVKANPGTIEQMNDQEITACFELQIVQMVSNPERNQAALHDALEDELRGILSIDTPAARKVGGKLVGCLLVALLMNYLGFPIAS